MAQGLVDLVAIEAVMALNRFIRSTRASSARIAEVRPDFCLFSVMSSIIPNVNLAFVSASGMAKTQSSNPNQLPIFAAQLLDHLIMLPLALL